jgi:hypothetical protein
MRASATLLVVALLAACSGGGGGGGGSGGGGGTTSYNVTAATQTGGTVTPASAAVQAGQTATFSITASSGYAIAAVTGCAGTLSGGTYTTAAVTTDCAISATFQALDFHVDVSGNALGGLVLENNGDEQVIADNDGRFTFARGINVGAPYAVRAVQQPAVHVCVVENGTGTIGTSPIAVSVQCLNRTITSLLMTLRTSVDSAGALQQFLYLRSSPNALRQYRIRSADGGLDEVSAPWIPSSVASTGFSFSPNGTHVFGDNAIGDVFAASIRENDGAIVPTWSSAFGNYVPTLPVLLPFVRASSNGQMLYRNVTTIINGIRIRDLWVGTLSSTGVTTLSGAPFPIGSDGGGPNFDPTGRYLARTASLSGAIEVYPAFTSSTQSANMLHSYPTTLPANWVAAIFSDFGHGSYLYENAFVTVTGSTNLVSSQIAVHAWQPDGSLDALGGALDAAPVSGEIASEVCTNGETATRRISSLLQMPRTRTPLRYFIQRQDAYCMRGSLTGLLADSRVQAVHVLNVTNGQAALAALPLETLPGWADVGGGGAAHPTKSWLYLGSKHSQRVYGYAFDAAARTAQPIPGSPFDGTAVLAPTGITAPTVVLDPTGKFLYMTRYSNPLEGASYIDAFSVDQTTGALTAVATYTP